MSIKIVKMNKAPTVDEIEAFFDNNACRRGIRDVAQAVFVLSGSHLCMCVKHTAGSPAFLVLLIFRFTDRFVC